MTDEHSDHPDYESLIAELKALKRFIESDDPDGLEFSNDAALPQAVSSEPPEDFASQPDVKPEVIQAVPEDDDDGELPRLNSVVHRPEQQLDLLTDAIPSVNQRVEPELREPSGQLPMQDQPRPEPESEPEPGALDMEAGSDTEAIDSEPASSTDAETQPDEDIESFVYDLADRIIQTLDNKLMARSGSELPDELREEFREAVADILYEWT